MKVASVKTDPIVRLRTIVLLIAIVRVLDATTTTYASCCLESTSYHIYESGVVAAIVVSRTLHLGPLVTFAALTASTIPPFTALYVASYKLLFWVASRAEKKPPRLLEPDVLVTALVAADGIIVTANNLYVILQALLG
jgi:hypothetical protein